MKNQDLAARKITEKAARRKANLKTYRELTSTIPDFLNYSQIPIEEKPKAITGTPAQRRKLRENTSPVKTAEELAADVAMIENYRHRNRPVFHTEVDRYQWILDQKAGGRRSEVGGGISAEDERFMREYESRMDAETREYWDIYKQSASGGGS